MRFGFGVNKRYVYGVTSILAVAIMAVLLYFLYMQKQVVSSHNSQSVSEGHLIAYCIGDGIPGYTACDQRIAFNTSTSTNINEPIVPNCKDRKIDISQWKAYSNPEYGYEFKFPATWKVVIPSPGYIADDGSVMLDPNDVRYHDYEGMIPYQIGIRKTAQPLQLPISPTTAVEAIGEMVTGLPSSLFSSIEFGGDESRKMEFYNIDNNLQDANAFIVGKTSAYEISLDYLFRGGASAADVDAFCGALLSFRVIAEN
jgi:hypothetical protein